MLTPDKAVLTTSCSPASAWKSKRAMTDVPVRLPSVRIATVSRLIANGREKRVQKNTRCSLAQPLEKRYPRMVTESTCSTCASTVASQFNAFRRFRNTAASPLGNV